MITELIRAFALITIAEMGDKTQLLSMTFATKYSTKKVLLGVAIGACLNHGLAILFGTLLSNYIDISSLQVLGGIMFLIFGLWGLKVEVDDDEEEQVEKYGPIFTVALAFFVGELGDKTQLAAMTIATYAKFPVFILMGTVLGMVFTSSIGIFVGNKIGNKVPEIYIKLVSSGIFLIFGFSKLYSSLPERYLSFNYFGVFSLAIILVAGYMVKKVLKQSMEESKYKRVAEILKNQHLQLRSAVEGLCLGSEYCKNCEGKSCAIGFIKHVLDSDEIAEGYGLKFSKKDLSESKLIEALSLTVLYYFSNREADIADNKLMLTKDAIEKALLGETVTQNSSIDEYIQAIKHIQFDKGSAVEVRLKELKDRN